MLRRFRYMARRAEQKAAYKLVSPLRSLGEEGGPRIALTFDDGPDPVFTPLVLEALARRSAKATFFLVGERARRHPKVVEEIVAAGHAVGSHTRSHPDMWTVPFAEVRRQYVEGRDQVEQAAGRDAPLVRPPKGWLDTRAGSVIRRHGFRAVLWNTSGEDWVAGSTPSTILASLGDPGAGQVVLLHDSIEAPTDASQLDRTATVESVGPFVDRVLRAGFELVTLH